ncbi:bifunctional ADP-dependent NAD(P)H-hydrate dehydratase/NAD(P)H-hydrate epimerase [Bifidobacterium tsurumiense]|uniref:bifunctional ADP-dependent NAD(P)H-hydrate dehydratase/NAD(P)H-hydrate epimerase n=1 Tax=Bifidobacterium tsurumiense TaxID=356829 RepID=UPI0012B2D4BE|nr:bifunctional ADP-dependent NAD(P)H-hydrate dehydratase/NAD(P)H-hydrate epimerase [Bifidobacterium tsurumiense]MDY4678079.1 bifunctional ADP-dependent NAD(P)H-hydrate dehydratase/NAD(P)H-hydrate epimerase [Bifidobacterium tsurumiense]MSS11995.1 bifunctional ADP-dependent NAD(P)H-hydrate dehydratase/NAD(P)H-hydrate epimerase [Bifidobacterium tsurumiense]
MDLNNKDTHAYALLHNAYVVNHIREFEEPLLRAGVPLMTQAAAAIAHVACGVLASRPENRPRNQRIVVLCGSGNNGGDGLYAGAILADKGFDVCAIAVGATLHDGGLAALLQAGGKLFHLCDFFDTPDSCDGSIEGHIVKSTPAEAVELVSRADVVLDAITGIGAQGPLRGVAKELVNAINHSEAWQSCTQSTDRAHMQCDCTESPRPSVIAVDAPSGIGVDDGSMPGDMLAADVTITFGALKPCLILPPACFSCGRIIVVDFDFPLHTASPVARAMDADIARKTIRLPQHTDSKYSRGVVGLITGSAQYPGAAVLSAEAAARSNVGMVRYLGPDRASNMVLAQLPEAVLSPGRVQSWIVGSGVPDTDDAYDTQREHIASLLKRYTDDAAGTDLHDVDTVEIGAAGNNDPERNDIPSSHHGSATDIPLCVDAGALSLLPQRVSGRVIITPHSGELSRLLKRYGESVTAQEINAEPYRWARRIQQLTGATVLLKGACTIVVGPDINGDIRTITVDSAPSWLATAGAGDVLAGVMGALLAQTEAMTDPNSQTPNFTADIAASAAFIHGNAARAAAGMSLWSLTAHISRYDENADFQPTESSTIGHPIVASDVIGSLPQVVEALFSDSDS